RRRADDPVADDRPDRLRRRRRSVLPHRRPGRQASQRLHGGVARAGRGAADHPGGGRDHRAVRGQPSQRRSSGVLGLPRLGRAAADRRRHLGAAGPQPLEHGDPRRRRSRGGDHALANGSDLDDPGRLARKPPPSRALRMEGAMSITETRPRMTGIGRVLVIVYAIMALAATGRSFVQIVRKFDEAPLAYSLSALAAVIYIVATLGLVFARRRGWYTIAWIEIGRAAGRGRVCVWVG